MAVSHSPSQNKFDRSDRRILPLGTAKHATLATVRGENLRYNRGVRRQSLQGCHVLCHKELTDGRGWFKYVFQASGIGELETNTFQIQQGNHSWSRRGTLRGIHREPWTKLVYVPAGHVRVCVVNLVVDHPEFGDHMLTEIGDFEGGRCAIFIPLGFGNAFYAIEDSHYLNFVSREFSDKERSGLMWNEPRLSIAWGFSDPPILSEQDCRWPPMGASTFPDLSTS